MGKRLWDLAKSRIEIGTILLAHTEPWLSGCQVLSGDLSGCRAAVRHCQVPLSDQLSGAVSAVGCCRVRV